MVQQLTTMNISEDNRNWLHKTKRKLKARSYDQVITVIRKMITHYKLHQELRAIK